MGEIYSEGLGVAQDFAKAADAYAQAADLGDANAQFSLGSLVAEGLGVQKDLRIAADLFEQAAQNGNEAAALQSLPHLSPRQRRDLSTRPRRSNGCRKRLKQGNPRAQYDLGAFYQFGRGVPIDKAKAAEWTARASDAGLPEAQVEYGVMLFKGDGVAIDEARAARLFRLAAEQGNPVAQNRLARLYANGVVVKADPVQAAKWHLLARAAGVSDFSLDIMLARLTPEERVQAERRSRPGAAAGSPNNSDRVSGARCLNSCYLISEPDIT